MDTKKTLKKLFRLIKIVYAIAIYIFIFAFAVYINVSNPDMTDMRLLLTHWQSYLIMFALSITGYIAGMSAGND